MGLQQAVDVIRSAVGQIAQGEIVQTPARHPQGVGLVGASGRIALVEITPAVRQFLGQGLQQAVPSADDGLHVDRLNLFEQIALARQQQHFPEHGAGLGVRRLGRVADQGAEEVQHAIADRSPLADAVQLIEQQALHGIPAGEAIAVVACQKG